MTGSRRLLLVEGENDKHVIMHLCNHHGLVIDDREISPPKDPKTGRSVDGVEAVTGSLSTQLKQADLSVLGVVLDADQDPQRRLDQVATALAKENHHLPSGLRPDGLIDSVTIGTRRIRFDLWLMPDNDRPGELEDFYRGMIKDDDSMGPYVDEFRGSIPAGERRFSPNDQTKAWIHGWLAVQKSPGRPMGLGLSMYPDRFNARSDEAERFVRWLRRLLESQPTKETE